MNLLLLSLIIFCAGGSGAWCRFHLDTLLKDLLSYKVTTPTFTINLLGSFGIGILTGVLAGLRQENGGVALDGLYVLSALLSTGFLGGFTTFSTAMVEAVTAGRDARPTVSLWLLLGQCLLCVLVAGAGLILYHPIRLG